MIAGRKCVWVCFPGVLFQAGFQVVRNTDVQNRSPFIGEYDIRPTSIVVERNILTLCHLCNIISLPEQQKALPLFASPPTTNGGVSGYQAG